MLRFYTWRSNAPANRASNSALPTSSKAFSLLSISPPLDSIGRCLMHRESRLNNIRVGQTGRQLWRNPKAAASQHFRHSLPEAPRCCQVSTGFQASSKKLQLSLGKEGFLDCPYRLEFLSHLLFLRFR